MLHFLTKYYFLHQKINTKNASKIRHHVGSHEQAKNMKCYTSVTFSGIHTNKTQPEEPPRKNGDHVTFPYHTWVLHVTVPF